MVRWPNSLTLVGAGKMGGALFAGWLERGLPAERLTIIDPSIDPTMRLFAEDRGIHINPAAARPSDVLLLAIKPQMLADAAAGLQSHVRANTLIVSILAGSTLSGLRRHFPAAYGIVRTMPNTPAAVGRGMSGACAETHVDALRLAQAGFLMEAVGQCLWFEQEEDIDRVTAVSGSGPAYVFYLVEALAKAAEAIGLSADIAMQLARATVEGAGELLSRSPETEAGQLRRNVTSPGGTTAAALNVLMAETGLQPLMDRAVAAAEQRSKELAS